MKMMKYPGITLILFVLCFSNGLSQIYEPVEWQFNSKKLDEQTYKLIFTAGIQKGWHLYSQDIAEQPPATLFVFNDVEGIERVGSVAESKTFEEYDPNFDMVLKMFKEQAIFTQKIKVNTREPVVYGGYLEFMACEETRCLPLKEVDFQFEFNQERKEVQSTGGENALTDDFDITGRDQQSMWAFFLLSLVFGFAAILTPCVFPMIPLTVSFFIKEQNTRGKLQATVYGLSIVVIYVLIGTLLAIFLGPAFANFISTHWLPNILFFLIFMVFAASFFGMFEITMPSWLVNKSDRQAERGGLLGPVFMALTLILVSFSCTGPIVGMILVESAGGVVTKPVIGMLGFSLAFAMPFTLLAFFPSWLKKLPKSGGWMNSVKVVLAFIELALGLKFLSIPDQTYHWGLLDREVYLAFWIVIFTMMGFYLLGKIKFPHDSEVKHVSTPRVILSIITFAFVVYLIPGMVGAPLKAMSGYLPPQHSQDFDLNKIIRENVQTMLVNGSVNHDKTTICGEPKYADFLHLPHGLKGYFDYDQALACAEKQNKPVFVDFTGHGCVNCREMEASVWSDPAVLKRLRDNFVVVALYVDDKTKLSPSEWVVSDYDGEVKKTIGSVNADLQIEKFGVNAQPYYVLLDHEGKLLVQPRAYDLDVGNFIEFLDRGLEEHLKRQDLISEKQVNPASS